MRDIANARRVLELVREGNYAGVSVEIKRGLQAERVAKLSSNKYGETEHVEMFSTF